MTYKWNTKTLNIVYRYRRKKGGSMESFDDEQTLDFFDVYLPDTNGHKLVIYLVICNTNFVQD